MGTYPSSPAQMEQRRLGRDALAAYQTEKDMRFPPMERPCGTPGAVYTITVEGNDLGCTAHLPFDIATALPAEAAEKMKQALHDAVLPIVEAFYRRVWDQTIAGRIIDGDDKPMPETWEGLFFKWLDRCVDRGEMPVFNGVTIWNRHSVWNLKMDAARKAKGRP